MAYLHRVIMETERLMLRRWTIHDLNSYALFAADPVVMMAAGAQPVLSPGEAQMALRRSIEDPYCFAMQLKQTGQVIGMIKYQKDVRRIQVNGVSIAYELAQAYWGNGYMAEALRAMIRYAFEMMHMDVVGISHFAENQRSRRVIEKAGFYAEGVIPCAFRRFDGAVFDEVSYSILREEYFTGQKSSRRGL